MKNYLKPTGYLDYNEPALAEVCSRLSAQSKNNTDRSIKIFNYVRDFILYNPYVNIFDESIYRASAIITMKSNFCVPKAVLLAALLRGAGIPSRLRFATIRNTQLPEAIKDVMQSDIIHGHGFAEVYLNEQWIKATPAFDAELCMKNNYKLVEFDGTNDAVFQSHDLLGRPHIEYLDYSEPFDDLPYQWLHELYMDKYKKFLDLEQSDQ